MMVEDRSFTEGSTIESAGAAILRESGTTGDPIRSAFVMAIIDHHTLRRAKDEAVKRLLEEMEPVGVKLIEFQLSRLLRAAGVLTMSLDFAEARAVMAAIDLILELVEDADLRERMAKRQESYEHTILEMERDMKPLDPDQIRAMRRFTRGLLLAEEGRSK